MKSKSETIIIFSFTILYNFYALLVSTLVWFCSIFCNQNHLENTGMHVHLASQIMPEQFNEEIR
jgi:hypothetical protein